MSTLAITIVEHSKAAAYLEGDLSSKDELVLLKESSGGVLEDHVCDAVNEVEHSLLDLLRHLSSLDGILEHHTEGLKQNHTLAISQINAHFG